MNDGGLSAAFDRAERALERIQRVLAARTQTSGHDDDLRSRVREAIAELDELIRESAG